MEIRLSFVISKYPYASHPLSHIGMQLTQTVAPISNFLRHRWHSSMAFQSTSWLQREPTSTESSNLPQCRLAIISSSPRSSRPHRQHAGSNQSRSNQTNQLKSLSPIAAQRQFGTNTNKR